MAPPATRCPRGDPTVTFFNVNQGDCSLFATARGDYKVLVDGGTQSQSRRHEAALAAELPIDLIVGTHVDGDHIGGLIRLVRLSRPGDIGFALLPPYLDSLGRSMPGSDVIGGLRGPSPFLADRLRVESAAEALAELDARAAEAVGAVRAIVADLAGIERGVRQDAEGGPGRRRPKRRGPRLTERLTRMVVAAPIARRLNLGNLAYVVDAAAVALDRTGQRAPFRQARWLITTGEEVATELLNVDATADLIHELDAKGVPWSTRPAPNVLDGAYRGPIDLWHLAPTEAYVRARGPLLERSWTMLFALADVGKPQLPSQANRLSHVIAIGESGREGRVIFTGDTGFERESRRGPDSLAVGWARIVASADLIDLPHHGGNWGQFDRRMLDAMGSRERRLHVSVAPMSKVVPPSHWLGEFLSSCQTINASTTLIASNRPRPKSIIGHKLAPTVSVGPERVVVHLGDEDAGVCSNSPPGAIIVG